MEKEQDIQVGAQTDVVQDVDASASYREQMGIYAASSANGSAGGSTLGAGIVLIIFAIAIVVFLWIGSGLVAHHAKEQGAFTLRESILDSAMQCFAIEGCYPANLKYLEDNYGLSVNNEEYSVVYEAFASNVLPSVVVKPR